MYQIPFSAVPVPFFFLRLQGFSNVVDILNNKIFFSTDSLFFRTGRTVTHFHLLTSCQTDLRIYGTVFASNPSLLAFYSIGLFFWQLCWRPTRTEIKNRLTFVSLHRFETDNVWERTISWQRRLIGKRKS